MLSDVLVPHRCTWISQSFQHTIVDVCAFYDLHEYVVHPSSRPRGPLE